MKKLICLIVLLMTTGSVTFSESITLKSGKTIEGKILERTEEYIKIDFYGVPITYYLDEIESINGESILSATEIKPLVPQTKMPSAQLKSETEPNTYVNEEYKVSIEAPEGWHIIRIEKSFGITRTLVKFYEYPASSFQFSKGARITLEVLQPRRANNLDEYLESYLKISKFAFEPLGPPKKVLINGNEGVRLDSQLNFAGTVGGRSIEYLFWKNNLIYMLALTVGEKEDMAEFDKYIEIVDNCASTLIMK